jgi:PAS domain S-box-containing protein
MTILASDFEVALQKKEFKLYYQPKLDLGLRKIEGVEALLRWDHPEKGIIPPLAFISSAEKSGMIIAIGEWVIQKACKQNKVWMEAGLPPLTIAINLSEQQLNEPSLVNVIQKILKDTALPPKYLEFEIKESHIIHSPQAVRTLFELKKIGVRISLTNFRTTPHSLNHLMDIPIDIIKIDRSSIKNCIGNTKEATVVKEIIAKAHKQNIKVVAEGVESRDQLMFLQQNLCDNGQGYLFSKPLPKEELVRKFNEIERVMVKLGIQKEESRDKSSEKESEMTHQDLLDTIKKQEGMIFKFIEKDGRFIHTLCDGELMYRMGYTSEQIVGKELGDFLPYPESHEKQKYYERAWAGEEHVLYEREDKGIWYFVTLRPIRRNGQVIEVIASCVDITKRKKAEESIRESEKLSVIERLAIGVAHEIRNPLTSIMGFTRLLKKEAENPFYYNLILSNASRLEKIVSEFLMFAQLEQTQMEIIDANKLLKDTLKQFRSGIHSKKVQIIENLCDHSLPIYCDVNQIKQVVIKILQNAVDALPNGGEVEISTKLSGTKDMVFEIADLGCGISEERMKYIGEPFYSTKEKGIGLGLMIGKKIIKGHGGSINIESQVDKGTTVEIHLPLIS